ncbi:S10 family peptidase [Alteromonas lipolytica]|uniref:Serine carboxypeptidase n=1 Tax=Alteromonas lipolytica TaxID=1856405 RepID=A0A1E8FJR8_9ALTE|nr:serine carboxypeptidase [Alteromonas lipolytica]OFI36172.1 serine carboxypeptidase [Alteromonas lipolytica]GGF78374.1 carboxypeptidase [Alteromonas lipolytica]
MQFKQHLKCLLVLVAMALPVGAQATDTNAEAAPKRFITEHKGQFNGQKVSYNAVAGETFLRDLKGAPKASIFSFAYLKENAKPSQRPVTFVWNGGPGSASVWLHMSGLGPAYVSVPSDASHPGLPPYQPEASSASVMDVTDLVFIDPVGTGFSRALGEHEGKAFWGLKEDAQSMAEFIRTWMTENNRWGSPVFILGESYGTTRAAYVANILQKSMKINVNGLVFVSQALDYQGSSPYIPDNIISFVTYLPTMAATALYHHKVTPAEQNQTAFLAEARRFAMDELLPGLFAGNRLAPDQRTYLAERLAYFTGLNQDYIERADLRISARRFAKELLRNESKTVGLLDARYLGDERDDIADATKRDAASDSLAAAFNSALQVHMHNSLQVNWERQYLSPADPNLSRNWRYRTTKDGSSWEPSYVNTARELSEALRINPQLDVLVASGYYDLVTPFFDAEYTLNRHGINSEQIWYSYYEGGHMMYVNGEARIQLFNDIRSFIEGHTPTNK